MADIEHAANIREFDEKFCVADIEREAARTGRIAHLAEYCVRNAEDALCDINQLGLVLRMGTMDEDFTLCWNLHGSKHLDIMLKPSLDTEEPKYIHTLVRIASLLEHTPAKRVFAIGCPDETFFRIVPAHKCVWAYLNSKAETEWNA
jgi:hypothetical protein